MEWVTIILSILVGLIVLGGITIWCIVHYFNRIFKDLEELKDLEDDD